MMVIQQKEVGMVTFHYNSLTTEVFVEEQAEGWEVEIYKHRHFLASLEINKEGKIYIVEDFGLEYEQVKENEIELK